MLTVNSIPNKLKDLVRQLLAKDQLLTTEASARDPSQFGEAKIVGLIIQCLAKQGFDIPKSFLEIGANSPYHLSSSWYLEKSLGFEGVSIDPINDLSLQFSKYRPKTKFINKAFCSSLPKSKKIAFYLSNINVLSTCDLKEVREMKKIGVDFDKIEVETIYTDEIITFYRERVGVLILDIESLALQLDALREIITTKLKPFIICVETLDFSPSSGNLRSEYDKLLNSDYTLAAGTYLNSIYTCKSLLVC